MHARDICVHFRQTGHEFVSAPVGEVLLAQNTLDVVPRYTLRGHVRGICGSNDVSDAHMAVGFAVISAVWGVSGAKRG